MIFGFEWMAPQPANTPAGCSKQAAAQLSLRAAPLALCLHRTKNANHVRWLRMPKKSPHLGGKCKFLIDSAELRIFFVIFVQNDAVMMIGRVAEKEKLIKAYESDLSTCFTWSR